MGLGRAAWAEARETLQKILSANEVMIYAGVLNCFIILNFIEAKLYVLL